jgi:serine/threonine-protein kinase
MSNGPRKSTPDPAVAQQISTICAEYVSACQQSGRNPPPIDTFLDKVDPTHQELLRLELEKIRTGNGKGPAELDSRPRATIDVAPCTSNVGAAPLAPLGTMDVSPPPGDGEPAATGGTIDIAGGNAAADSVHERPVHTLVGTAAGQTGGSPANDGMGDLGFSLSEDIRQASPELIEVPGYDIVGELGRGGMGVVYKARQTGLNRWVALKMVLAGGHAGPVQLGRFRAEAEAVAGLQHPNIIQIYEVGQHRGLPYFSLEFVDGGSLAEKVHRQAQPPRNAAHMIETLARAMDYAHQRGIIHRDLKPANVLLTANGIPKITDFGLAKKLEGDSSQTKSGTLLGTPSYMAPEQARGEIHNIGPLADVYALGAMLYELLTGRPPFQAATPMDTLMRVTQQEVVPPSRMQPNIPRDLETICLKCLEKESNKRYATADRLAEDLRRFLSAEPILARPISGPERLLRWGKRNPKLALSLASIALLLIGVAGISLGAYFQISAEQARTEAQKKLAEAAAEQEKVARYAAEAAEKKAEQHAKIAGDQRTLALNTLYGVLTRFEATIRDKEGMSELRKELTQMTAEGLKQVSRSVENAPLVDRSMGLSLQKMGDYYYEMGNTEEALKQIKKSLEIFEGLERTEPHDWLPFNSAISYDSLARTTRELVGDTGQALEYLQRSMHLREQLLTRTRTPQPSADLRRIALVISYDKIANVCDEIGDLKKAHDYATKSMQLSQEILKKSPQDLSMLQTLSGAYRCLGKNSDHSGNRDGGDKYYPLCLGIWEDATKAIKGAETNVIIKKKTAWSHLVLGDRAVELGQYQKALEEYNRANEMFLAIHKKEPQNAELQWWLANSHYGLASAKRLMGDRAGAHRDDQAALRLREGLARTDPNNFQRIEELMVSRARCGNYRDAAAAADALCKRAPRDVTAILAAACCYATCARAIDEQGGSKPASASDQHQKYVNSGLESIKRLIALGYKDVYALEHNPDLEVLQEHAEYKTALAKLK